MAIVSVVIFFAALAGIIALFVHKSWEIRRGRPLSPALRQSADIRALDLKAQLAESRAHLGNIPPLLNRFGWFLIHESALGIAAFARVAEREAHRLADIVSQKHRFKPGQTRSEFLKKVSEGKNGTGLDTTSGNGHNT